MNCIEYKIFRSNLPSLEDALKELLSQADPTQLTPVRLVVFSDVRTNEEFAKQRQMVEQQCKEHYADSAPMVALIAQAPFDATFAAEVTFIDPKQVKITHKKNYILLNDELLLSGAIYSSTQYSIAKQSDQIFTSLEQMLTTEGLRIDNIVRQWNFIENITTISPKGQNYQQFNDSRSRFYAKTEWANGYPAATGIGTTCGGVSVIVDALLDSSARSQAIDNPLQISAHAYSQRVLIDSDTNRQKSTPKFERARRVEWNNNPMIYVSGTAAIRGEESCSATDIEQQINLTMDNIDCLISENNILNQTGKSAEKYKNSMLRIYLKRRSNWPIVKQWIADNCHNIEILCVEADICREELLIEIEGIANINS